MSASELHVVSFTILLVTQLTPLCILPRTVAIADLQRFLCTAFSSVTSWGTCPCWTSNTGFPVVFLGMS